MDRRDSLPCRLPKPTSHEINSELYVYSFAVRLLATDPRLAVAVYFGLFTPYQYRLVGPGAWRGARDAMLSARERMLQPLMTRSVAVATNDSSSSSSSRRSLLVPACMGAAVVALAWLLYRRRADWNWDTIVLFR